ncbi:leader peptidase (prepilin peptidase) / N-methyltransferase [Actinacidiphila paucisporea]|uniref:Leader peptidase (Prepilin peptidase) / N-methyltransferase n=2 Tax=Actinacidiphila paucisporea TaxID=310782 RepID=A0A1M6UIE1_9ACTN|nr:leader peptidase (prepilin peptidase) / N-methyltransferase [Actinacidiphila paucisporea]
MYGRPVHVYPIVAAAVWGTVSGYLFPRAAHRLAVPPGEPRSATCLFGHPLPPGPRGWLGTERCARCGTAGWRHRREMLPAIGCALLCAALAAATGPHPELVVWLLLVPVALTLARVDLRVFRLPDVLTLPAFALTATLLGGAALLPAHQGSWTRALLAAAAVGALYSLLFLVNPAGMGLGDVKLAPTAALALGWYGWGTVITGTFAAFALGAVVGLALLLTGRATRKSPMPFGPFILTGCAVALLLA